MLYSLENNRSRWTELEYKQLQISRLEEAAKCIETYIPKRLICGDFITHIWLTRASQNIATTLRAKKRWLLTPKPDTYDCLIKNISSTLTCILNGDWDTLVQTDLKTLLEEEHISLPKLWWSQFLNLLRIIVIAILPITAILIIQRTPAASFLGTLYQPLTIGSLLWALYNLLATLEPNLSSKVSTFKDITSLLPTSQSDKK